jgi:hypothetical protein
MIAERQREFGKNPVQKISRRLVDGQEFFTPPKITYHFQRPSKFPWMLGEMLGYRGTCY